MYPDEIKRYTTEKQFNDHQKMLDEMKAHFKQSGSDRLTLENIHKEERLLARIYKKWQKQQGKEKQHD